MTSESHDKEPLTRLNEALRDVRKIGERWNDRLTLEGMALAKDYREGRVELLATLKLSRINSLAIDGRNEVRPVYIRLKICST